MVSARSLPDAGLQFLRPEFGKLFRRGKSREKAEWANPVDRLRQVWRGDYVYKLGEPELSAILSITELFESPYKVVMAASFTAMMPSDSGDGRRHRRQVVLENVARSCSADDSLHPGRLKMADKAISDAGAKFMGIVPNVLHLSPSLDANHQIIRDLFHMLDGSVQLAKKGASFVDTGFFQAQAQTEKWDKS